MSPFSRANRAETSVLTFTELPINQESAQEEDYLNVPGCNTDSAREIIIGLGFGRLQTRSKHPTRPNSVGDNGDTFFKKLQPRNRVYNPYTRTFGRVVAWNRGQAQVRAINKATATYQASYIQHIRIWSFGEFAIRLKCSCNNRQLYAYVSPYTHEDSSFLKTPSRLDAHLRTISHNPRVVEHAAYHDTSE